MTTVTPRLADLDFDPKAVGRWVRELPVPDVAELARRADVPHHVDTGLNAASAAFRTAIEQLPSQRRRRRRRSFALVGALVITVALIGLASLWTRRLPVVDAAGDADTDVDVEALDRAADDGANIAIDTGLASTPEPPAWIANA